ncbi:hypothetical protein Tco_0989487 [Tanacetum coccineum]|uniref:Uncharacterized protein n=1 Tax=Tanacetum coccineum TaxID=301880 RepID=A0ABQ5ETS6_9ASTR
MSSVDGGGAVECGGEVSGSGEDEWGRWGRRGSSGDGVVWGGGGRLRGAVKRECGRRRDGCGGGRGGEEWGRGGAGGIDGRRIGGRGWCYSEVGGRGSGEGSGGGCG